MASLTPLSKGLIGLAVIGAMASAVWHLGLKDQWSQWSGKLGTQPPATPSVAMPPSSSSPPSAAAPAGGAAAGAATQLSAATHAETGRALLAKGDYGQARVHLEAAVQGGDGAAACHLGEMALKGQGGLAASQEQAAKLFQLAQSRGSICFAPAQ
ncbi:MAG: hypothetical protein ACT4NV_07305 [Rhodoferax sp.]